MDPAMSCMTNNLCLSRNLRANDGRTRDSVRGCVGIGPMVVVRVRPWQEFQNVHATALAGTPCHSIVAPSLLIVHEMFTKVAQ